jgi:hypothetical protein
MGVNLVLYMPAVANNGLKTNFIKTAMLMLEVSEARSKPCWVKVQDHTEPSTLVQRSWCRDMVVMEQTVNTLSRHWRYIQGHVV